MKSRLPPPTMQERAAAAKAARTLRTALDNPAGFGAGQTLHIDYSRPRRGEWITTWPALPGFMQINGVFSHASLPGWTYTRAEIPLEMIPDLEVLAERGLRPTETTSPAVTQPHAAPPAQGFLPLVFEGAR